MQKFKEFNVIFISDTSEVLEGLGIETEKEYYTGPGTIDLNQVEAFWTCERMHEGKTTVNCQLKSAEIFSLAIPYEDFKKLFND